MLQQRLDILQQAGQIDETVKQYLMDVIELIEQKFGIKLTEDNGAMIITHFAMAISRLQKGESSKKMDEPLYELLLADANYEKGKQMWNVVSANLPVPFTEEEADYMVLHFCTLLTQEG